MDDGKYDVLNEHIPTPTHLHLIYEDFAFAAKMHIAPGFPTPEARRHWSTITLALPF